VDVKLGLSLSLRVELHGRIDNKVTRKVFGPTRYKEQRIKECEELHVL
jgi:hypothetical protein